jgi:hypothetical protein
LRLLEYDVFGEVRGETDLAAPTPPEGFEHGRLIGMVVADDGSLLVHGELDRVDETALPLHWAAKY